jgi:hypothetical protein
MIRIRGLGGHYYPLMQQTHLVESGWFAGRSATLLLQKAVSPGGSDAEALGNPTHTRQPYLHVRYSVLDA